MDLGPAAFALIPAALAAGQPSAPIDLVAETAPAGVTLRVVGRSSAPMEAQYRLEVSSGPGAGSNRSTQSGSVRLEPGEERVLLTTRLGGVAERDWRALLTVTPRTGEPYRIERRAE